MSQEDKAKCGMPQLKEYHKFSQKIVSNLIQQQILKKALRSCLPRKIVYLNCCNEAQKFESDLVAIEKTFPDTSPTKIDKIQYHYVKKPTTFKVKQYTQLSSSPNVIKKMQINSQKWLKPSLKIIQAKLQKAQSQINIQNTLANKKERKNSFCVPNKSFQRFIPSQSSHESEKTSKQLQQLKRKARTKQSWESQDQIIRVLRQNKLYSNVAKNQALEKQSIIRKEELVKKTKDPKKCLAPTTDYNGYWMHISKNEINRQIPHYIEVQVELPPQQQPFETLKLTTAPNQEVGLGNDFANYKEIKLIERQDKFTTQILRKLNIKSQVTDDHNKQQRNHQIQRCLDQQNDCSQLKYLKLSGKTYKPNRVGFNVFQKLKKSTWKLEKGLQQKIQQDQLKSSLKLKKSSIKRRDSLNEQSNKKIEDTHSSFQRTGKKKANIVLGSTQAMNFLLNQDKRYQRKNVKIDQQFL